MAMDYVKFGPGSPPKWEEEDPTGALAYERAKRDREKQATEEARQKIANNIAAKIALDRFRAGESSPQAGPKVFDSRGQGWTQEMGPGRPGGEAEIEARFAAFQAQGQLDELKGSKDVDEVPDNNIDPKSSDGHGPPSAPITGMMENGHPFFTNQPGDYIKRGATDVGRSGAATAWHAAHPNPGQMGPGFGGENNFTQRLNTEPHIDPLSLRASQMDQDDVLRQEMYKRGQMGQQETDQREHAAGTDVLGAQEEAVKAKAAVDTTDPYIAERMKLQSAENIARTTGAAHVAGARAPGLVQRETNKIDRAELAHLRPAAAEKLRRENPGFMRLSPEGREQAIDNEIRNHENAIEKTLSGSRYNTRETVNPYGY